MGLKLYNKMSEEEWIWSYIIKMSEEEWVWSYIIK